MAVARIGPSRLRGAAHLMRGIGETGAALERRRRGVGWRQKQPARRGLRPREWAEVSGPPGANLRWRSANHASPPRRGRSTAQSRFLGLWISFILILSSVKI